MFVAGAGATKAASSLPTLVPHLPLPTLVPQVSSFFYRGPSHACAVWAGRGLGGIEGQDKGPVHGVDGVDVASTSTWCRCSKSA